MRCLGEFVGHIWQGMRAEVAAERSRRVEIRRETAEHHSTASDGRPGVILRRTVIDEVELKEPLR
jgi:hypothetical protein